MENYAVRDVLRDLLVPYASNTYRDETVDAFMLEIKNFRNTNNLGAHQLLSSAVLVLLDRCNFHKNVVEDWPKVFNNVFQPYLPLWKYLATISTDDDRSECVFQVFEYCQNPKRPHLGPGFYYIIGSLMAGNIVCPISAMQFTEAMQQSDEEDERRVAKKMVSFLSKSWP